METENKSDDVFNSPPLEGCPQGRGGCIYPQGRADYIHPNEEDVKISKHEPIKTQPTIFIGTIPLKLTPMLDLPCNILLKQRAKELRQAGNLPEVLFWMQVTKGRFHKIDFDRQRIIGNYIVDFYVKKLGLIIEIDGSSHIGKEEYDSVREAYLLSLNLTMYRIQVVDVMQRMGWVMANLENFIINRWNDIS